MATPKINGLLFEGWWRENIIAEGGASVRLVDLYRDYRRAVVKPVGQKAFVVRLNGLRVRQTKRAGERWCCGVRLRQWCDGGNGGQEPHGAWFANGRPP